MDLEKFGLLDNRNRGLWKDLNKSFSISIDIGNYNNYGCYTEGDSAIIYIDENNIDINSFTHELLHVLLHKKEIYFASRLELLISNDNTLLQFLSSELIEHIGNCLNHIKMLPIYLELGFDKKYFISDYDTNKCTKAELIALKNSFKVRGVYNTEIVDFYIGKYIAIKADPKKHINYPKALIELKKIDYSLFDILDKLIVDWNNMPLEKINLWDEDYISVSYDFYENLVEWTKDKTFI